MNAKEHAVKERQERRRLRQLLGVSEDGKLLMSVLEEMYFKGNLVGETPPDTYFNLGEREVVRFLMSIRDEKEKTDAAEGA